MHAGFATVSGSATPRWRIISARELTPEEKGDKHHVFINLLDQDGADARGTASVKSGWEGMTEQPVITPTDKRPPEPGGNVPIFEDQKLWIEVDAGTEESDRASGMDVHHAYEVIFQYVPAISRAIKLSATTTAIKPITRSIEDQGEILAGEITAEVHTPPIELKKSEEQNVT